MLGFTFAVSLADRAASSDWCRRFNPRGPQLAGTLKDQAGGVVGGTGVGLRKALVVAQVSLSLLLLIGAGLFMQSLQQPAEL